MSDAQTEARALVEEYGKRPKTSILINLIATALAEKDAELAKFDFEKHSLKVSLARAEAQLAETRKALNAGEALSRQLHAVIDRLNGQAYSSTLSALNYFDAARRALEEQGGENG